MSKLFKVEKQSESRSRIRALLRWLDRRIIAPLATSGSLRWQLAIILYLVRIGKVVGANYERPQVRTQEAPAMGTSDGRRQSAVVPGSFVSRDERFINIKRQHQLKQVREEPRQCCSGRLATLPRFFYNYEMFTTIYLSLSFIKYTFPGLLNKLLLFLLGAQNNESELIAGMPVSCIVPGRLMTIPVLANQFGSCFCGFNLIYRAWMWYAQRPYKFGLVDLLVQNERDMDKFYRECKYYHHYCNHHHQSRNLSPSLWRLQLVAPIERHPLSSLMCYKVTAQGQLRLRHNMKPDAYRRFKRYFALWTLLTCLLGICAALFVLPMCLLAIVLDYGYVNFHSGCNERLDLLYATGQLPLFSVTLTPHRRIMIAFDVFENFVIWFECFTSLLGMLPLLVLVNYHIIFQWQALHNKIVLAFRGASLAYYATQAPMTWAVPVAGQLGVVFSTTTYGSEKALMRQRWCTYKQLRLSKPTGEQPLEDKRLVGEEVNLAELQAEMRDLVRQIVQANFFMSDLLTLGVICWLLGVTFVGGAALAYHLEHPEYTLLSISFPTLIIYGLPVASIPTTLICLLFFRAHTNCAKTYKFLWTIVAHSRAHERKLNFTDEMVEYYVNQQKTCYKMFGKFPVKATSFLSLSGWTMSGMALLASMLSHLHELHQ